MCRPVEQTLGDSPCRTSYHASTPLNDRLLHIYLSDHFAGSAVARSRCSHAAAQNRGNEFGVFLELLLREIDEERETLRSVIERVGAKPPLMKVAVGAAFERLSRLKPDGQLRGYSPLTRLLEFEALSLGVEGKRLLWVALAELRRSSLAEFDFEALEQRAVAQRQGIEEKRLAAARLVLG